MNYPMGPTAVVQMGGLDRPPTLTSAGGYLGFLPPPAPRAVRFFEADGRRRPSCSLRARMAETGNPVGWGRPRAFRPVGPSRPPAGLPHREQVKKHTGFLSRGGPGRHRITRPAPSPDPTVSRSAGGRKTLRDFLLPGAASISCRISDVNPGVWSACAAASFAWGVGAKASADFGWSKYRPRSGALCAWGGFPDVFLASRTRNELARSPNRAMIEGKPIPNRKERGTISGGR